MSLHKAAPWVFMHNDGVWGAWGGYASFWQHPTRWHLVREGAGRARACRRPARWPPHLQTQLGHAHWATMGIGTMWRQLGHVSMLLCALGASVVPPPLTSRRAPHARGGGGATV